MNQPLVLNSENNTLSVVGINYKKADLETRGKFGFGEQQKQDLLLALKGKGVPAFILSTCNRTELYFDSENSQLAAEVFCATAGLKLEDYKDKMNFLFGEDAKRHLLKVSAGLDSQILGDFEIVGQIKRDYSFAKELDSTNANLERWTNTALQVSKRVKNETNISSGASSVAFASIEYLKKKGHSLKEKSVLVVGTGKIGINTCKNIIKHGSRDKITITNRTNSTAKEISEKLGVGYLPYEELNDAINSTDVLIIATGATAPIITKNHVENSGSMTIFDLSVPRNVCTSVDQLEHTEVLDVDQLSKTIEENTKLRKEQIPFAENIISEGLEEFNQWLKGRKRIQLITSIKSTLNQLGEKEITALRKSSDSFDQEQAEQFSERLINKIVNQFASHLTSEDCTDENELALKEIFQINH